jgi:hypothetical protein
MTAYTNRGQPEMKIVLGEKIKGEANQELHREYFFGPTLNK